MSTGQKISLDAFIAQVETGTPAAMSEALERTHATAAFLRGHLSRHADLDAQVRALTETLPFDLAAADEGTRGAAAREASRLVDDIRDRWIDADAPPLVKEIDRHLSSFRADLEILHRPGPGRLREMAHRIETLAEPGRQLEGIERAYLPWAIGAVALLIFGVVQLFMPRLLGIPSIWPTVICFCAVPAVAVHFAFRVLPRTRADTQIEALNRAHFLPLGGIYFPEGETPAGVVLVDWNPEPPPDPRVPKHPREMRDRDRDQGGAL